MYTPKRSIAAGRPPCAIILAAAALALDWGGGAHAQPAYGEAYAQTSIESVPAQTTPPSGLSAVPAYYSQQDLDRLLAPIALYPDALLSQVLMAATHPQDLAEAARWSREHPGWSGQAAIDAASPHDWDASVTSLLNVPQVLALLDQRPDWTRSLGYAFLNQEPHVLETVQALRRRAQAAGNLTPDLELGQSGNDILIGNADPQWIALPWYDPLVVYGRWWWPLAPVRWAAWPGLPRPILSSGFVAGHRVPFARRISYRQAEHLPYGRFDWHQRRLQIVHTHYVGNQAAYLSLSPWRRAAAGPARPTPPHYTQGHRVPPASATSTTSTATPARPAGPERTLTASPASIPRPAVTQASPAFIPNSVSTDPRQPPSVRHGDGPERGLPRYQPAPLRDAASQQINGHLGSRWTRPEGGQLRDGVATIINPRPGDAVPGYPAAPAIAAPLAIPARPGLMSAPAQPVARAERQPDASHHHGHPVGRPPVPPPSVAPSPAPPATPAPSRGQGQGQRRALMH